MIEIKFKKQTDTAKEPIQATEGACGYDIFAEGIEFKGGNEEGSLRQIIYKTNIAVELPETHAFLLLPRSSISKTGLRMSNSLGLIDSDYRGGIMAVFDLIDSNKEVYKKGDKIGQLILIEKIKSKFTEVTKLNETTRGEGGFGSSGK